MHAFVTNVIPVVIKRSAAATSGLRKASTSTISTTTRTTTTVRKRPHSDRASRFRNVSSSTSGSNNNNNNNNNHDNSINNSASINSTRMNIQSGNEYDAGNLWNQLVDFPCVFTFKVIGMSQGDFANDIIDSVALALEMDRKYLKTSFRDRGKYRSITVEAPVNTVDQIKDVYAAIDRDPRVKFKF